MKYQRRHYEDMAKILKAEREAMAEHDATGVDTLNNLEDRLVVLFSVDNPSFDTRRFLLAAR